MLRMTNEGKRESNLISYLIFYAFLEEKAYFSVENSLAKLLKCVIQSKEAIGQQIKN